MAFLRNPYLGFNWENKKFSYFLLLASENNVVFIFSPLNYVLHNKVAKKKKERKKKKDNFVKKKHDNFALKKKRRRFWGESSYLFFN